MSDEQLFRIAIGTREMHVHAPGPKTSKFACVAVRRQFSDAAITRANRHHEAEAWVAGDDANALAHAINGGGAGTLGWHVQGRMLRVYPDWDEIPRDNPDRCRFLIALLAEARAGIAAQLETSTGVRTLFLLPPPKEAGVEQETLEPRMPPFWLVYGLRRLRWPGQTYLRFDPNPLDAPALHVPAPRDEFSTDPMLQRSVGTWLSREAEANHALGRPLTVRLRAPGRQPSCIAPAFAALPLVDHARFRENTSETLHQGGRLIVYRDISGSEENCKTITISRQESPMHGEEEGYASAAEAPPDTTTSYTLRIEIDAWGRLRCQLLDPLGMPVALSHHNRVRPDRPETTLKAYRLHLANLMFPHSSDDYLLSRVSLVAPDASGTDESRDIVDLLDLTSFPGFPAEQPRGATGQPRYQLEPMQFWPGEMIWLGRELAKSKDVVLHTEMAASALDTVCDPDDPRTQTHSFQPADPRALEGLVNESRLVPHLKPIAEGAKSADPGESKATEIAQAEVGLFLEALARMLPSDTMQLSAELKSWRKWVSTDPTGVTGPRHQDESGGGVQNG